MLTEGLKSGYSVSLWDSSEPPSRWGLPWGVTLTLGFFRTALAMAIRCF